MVKDTEHERYLKLMKLCECADRLREKASQHPTTRSNDDCLNRFKREVTPGVVLELLRKIDILDAYLGNHEKALAKIGGISVDEVHALVNKVLTGEISV